MDPRAPTAAETEPMPPRPRGPTRRALPECLQADLTTKFRSVEGHLDRVYTMVTAYIQFRAKYRQQSYRVILKPLLFVLSRLSTVITKKLSVTEKEQEMTTRVRVLASSFAVGVATL